MDDNKNKSQTKENLLNDLRNKFKVKLALNILQFKIIDLSK